MNNTYCPLLFREVALNNGDVLQPCCQNHSHKISINESFEKSFNTGQLENVRQQMLAGETVDGCDQCYREESVGVESMRQRSIKKYGIIKNIEIHAIQIQFDNLCNLKCRMCTSMNSHLLYDDELSVLGKTLSPKKFITNTTYKEIDKTYLREIKLHGGEPLISPRAEEFFKEMVLSNEISKVTISTYTNGMVIPTDYILEAFKKCRFLDLYISIDGFGNLNEYIRGKSDFNKIVENLKFYSSLIDSRPEHSTFIGISTVVNVYNVNKLKDLDQFIAKEFPEFELEKKFLSYPDFLRIPGLPIEYKNKIQDSVKDYPSVLQFLNKEDAGHFEEFILYNNTLDNLAGNSLKDVNPELYEFIQSYKLKKEIKSVDLQKSYIQIE
jgi:hypothetical protein